MSFLQTACVFLLMLSCSPCVDIAVRGTEGEQVTIECPYAKGYEKAYKCFYKGNYKDYVIILQSNGGETSVDGRFSLRDDRKIRSLIVTIGNLRMEDAGSYICRAGWGYHKQIHLNVIRAPERPRPVQIFTSTIHPDQTTNSLSNTPPYLSTSDSLSNPQPSINTITDHHISSTGQIIFCLSSIINFTFIYFMYR
ncbi:CMRF35-like molecule 6 [Labeo rohita]|uniref:CMRF35-like molecule 6 n=1 Tax=Labeo rohita TaxID=84645 RepID=UPI0021E1DF05|nr:CMRF35-like molecule 6 [Labeo rohita]